MLIVLDKNLNIINKNTDILLDSNKEVGLEVKHRENQVYVMSHYKNTGQNLNLVAANKSFRHVEKFTYLGRAVTSQNYIHNEIKIILNLGNTCNLSLHNLSSSFLLPKNLKMKM
jgi:hypothetical protein